MLSSCCMVSDLTVAVVAVCSNQHNVLRLLVSSLVQVYLEAVAHAVAAANNSC
jgi:hypothetical protein